jgi:predicted polyphosphate/ATP-dependent NAD kinase
MQLGLIINPIAGIGGAVGLKGSDSVEIQRQALALGAEPQSHLRAALALEVLRPLRETFELVTPPGGMGENVALQCGFSPHLLPLYPYGHTTLRERGETTADDTIQAGREMLHLPVDLLLFAGGDGTARDVYAALGTQIPVLGIPAGVKIHSAVFATHPRAAGEIAAAFLRGERLYLRESEVLDLDEATYRTGTVITQLYGYLKVPYRPHLLQNFKVPTPASESVRAEAIAEAVIETMQPGWLYILGPGTTTRVIANRLGFPKTLVGVDVYTREGVVALDVGEARLLELVENQPARIIVTPIGGQGFLFGRGNQQISARVIQKVGRENILVVSLSEKLNALRGEPFLVDTGDLSVDEMLAGHLPVVVGYREKVIYRIGS